MTRRRTRQEIERRLAALEPDDATDDTGAPREITIRSVQVDADGECVGQVSELRVTQYPDGTQSSERDTFDLPNDRLEGEL
ncbi:hypothetical protein [Halopelagius fulvigenes]|uniref:hypothetical protein n=1 Tax=Halopelagius fulvigenes TaxID=1198324 RepID=UPI0036D2E6FA